MKLGQRITCPHTGKAGFVRRIFATFAEGRYFGGGLFKFDLDADERRRIQQRRNRREERELLNHERAAR